MIEVVPTNAIAWVWPLPVKTIFSWRRFISVPIWNLANHISSHCVFRKPRESNNSLRIHYSWPTHPLFMPTVIFDIECYAPIKHRQIVGGRYKLSWRWITHANFRTTGIIKLQTFMPHPTFIGQFTKPWTRLELTINEWEFLFHLLNTLLRRELNKLCF